MLTACEPGFHPASMVELSGTATLQYDTGRGAQAGDAGFGPPVIHVANPDSAELGWVRSGADIGPGQPNCNGWTTNDVLLTGTAGEYTSGTWDTGSTTGFRVQFVACGQPRRVWCVGD
jgi:hypothetical protein